MLKRLTGGAELGLNTRLDMAKIRFFIHMTSNHGAVRIFKRENTCRRRSRSLRRVDPGELESR